MREMLKQEMRSFNILCVYVFNVIRIVNTFHQNFTTMLLNSSEYEFGIYLFLSWARYLLHFSFVFF